jgi:hypothetical protein
LCKKHDDVARVDVICDTYFTRIKIFFRWSYVLYVVKNSSETYPMVTGGIGTVSQVYSYVFNVYLVVILVAGWCGCN